MKKTLFIALLLSIATVKIGAGSWCGGYSSPRNYSASSDANSRHKKNFEEFYDDLTDDDQEPKYDRTWEQ